MKEKGMLIENDTVYTKEMYLKFNQFHLRGKNILVPIISFLVLATLYFFAIAMIVTKASILACMGYMALAIIITLYYWFLPNVIVSRVFGADKTFENSKNHYTFRKDTFDVENQYGDTSIEYTALYRVYETEKFYYLYLNNRQAFLVAKSGFQEGNEEKVKKLLQQKLAKHYQLKK